MGPVEVLVVGFPGNQFTGKIVPTLQDLVARGVIQIVDGMFLTKGVDGSVSFVEFDEPDASPEVLALGELVRDAVDLVSAEDVDELAAGLEPGSSAAVLVFEHTWAKGFQDAVVDSGGVLISDFRVPKAVVDEVLAAVAELDEEGAQA
jgi:hypothetical protein